MPRSKTGSPSPGGAQIVFLCVLLGMLMAALDGTIVSTALPRIVSDLGGGSHLSWVVTGYLLAETCATPLWGKFGDLFGRKVVYQGCIAFFVAGSLLCGLSQSMLQLVLFRAVQGVGAGGLMVTAVTLIADVVPMRESGKYQAALAAVFGVTTVTGPLLGGLFVDQLSWRWAFYVNVPVGIVVFLLAGAIPIALPRSRPVVDYAGILLMTVFAANVTLLASWGGVDYSWMSPTIVAMAVLAILALTGFVLVERRAAEPLLPLRLFRNPVFTVCAVLSIIVGVAMLSGITYLPLYFQVVRGASATISGLRLLPLSFGLLIASFGSGFLVSQTGRYKIFPVVGTALMTVGLALLSRLDEHTGAVVVSVSMMAFGFGVGLLMSVLTIAVQNATEYRDLGVATSGITFLRTLAGSVGVALFGALFTSHLTAHLPSGLPAGVMRDPFAAHSLPVAAAAGYYRDYVSSLQILFLAGIPMAFLGFLTSLFLREVPLRTTSRATAIARIGESFGLLEPSDSTIELRRAVSALIRQDRTAGASILSRSGVDVDIAEGWMLGQVARAEAGNGSVSLDELGHATGAPPDMLRPAVDALVSKGYLRQEQQHLSVSGMGHTALQRMVAAWRDWLLERLADWNPEHQASLVEALDALAARVSGEQPATHVGLT